MIGDTTTWSNWIPGTGTVPFFKPLCAGTSRAPSLERSCHPPKLKILPDQSEMINHDKRSRPAISTIRFHLVFSYRTGVAAVDKASSQRLADRNSLAAFRAGQRGGRNFHKEFFFSAAPIGHSAR
jgi:hypothetical protein